MLRVAKVFDNKKRKKNPACMSCIIVAIREHFTEWRHEMSLVRHEAIIDYRIIKFGLHRITKREAYITVVNYIYRKNLQIGHKVFDNITKV